MTRALRCVILALACVVMPGVGIAGAQEIPMTSEMRARMTKAIQSHYPCPVAKFAFRKGQHRRGTIVQVHCGPVNEKHSAFDQVYRVIFAPNGRTFIRPWGK